MSHASVFASFAVSPWCAAMYVLCSATPSLGRRAAVLIGSGFAWPAVTPWRPPSLPPRRVRVCASARSVESSPFRSASPVSSASICVDGRGLFFFCRVAESSSGDASSLEWRGLLRSVEYVLETSELFDFESVGGAVGGAELGVRGAVAALVPGSGVGITPAPLSLMPTPRGVASGGGPADSAAATLEAPQPIAQRRRRSANCESVGEEVHNAARERALASCSTRSRRHP